METIEQLRDYLPYEIYDSICHISVDKRSQISEIRLRLRRACSITVGTKNEILIDYRNGQMLTLGEQHLQRSFKKICENSLYKYESEIRNGYITLPNGCRVGFCGSRTENGMIKDISSINIRISKHVSNAAAEIFDMLFEGDRVLSSLIVSEPCGGKTTILTDIALKLSQKKLRVCVIDERGEIAASHRGVPSKNVGVLCDVLDNYPKGEGMMIALRSLSPQVLICDEIGSAEDVSAMMQALNAGVPVIASAHATNEGDILRRPQLKTLLDGGAVNRIFFLVGSADPGKINKVMTVNELYENSTHRTDLS